MLHVTWVRWGKGVFSKLFVGLMALTRGVAIRRSFEAGLTRIAAARAQGTVNGSFRPR